MNAWSKFVAITVAGCLSTLLAGTALNAAEITVVSIGGPMPDVMGTLLPMFERTTGSKVKINFKAGPAITADVKQGAADLVITNTEVRELPNYTRIVGGVLLLLIGATITFLALRPKK